MKKFLFSLFLVFSAQMIYATAENQQLDLEDLMINTRSKCCEKPLRKSQDVLATLVGKELRSCLGSDILPTNGESRAFIYVLTVLNANTDVGLYRVRIDTFPQIPVRNHTDIFTLGRIGDEYIGHGISPIEGGQEILIKRVKNNLIVTFSDIYDELFATPIVAQQRAVFRLPSH